MSSTSDTVPDHLTSATSTTASNHVVKKHSSSQSLFQIYYLDRVPVDRRCSSAVLPWIIEELKLKAQMKLMWLTPGPQKMTYVADNGLDLFSHPYCSIVRYCISTDRISIAYICQGETDHRYFCHVFQALTYEEAELIIKQFTDHVREEKIENTDTGILQTAAVDSRLAEVSRLQSQQEYHLKYLGNMESDPPTSPLQTQFIDSCLVKLKVEHSAQQRQAGKTSSALLDYMAFASPSPTLGRHARSNVSVISEETEDQSEATPLQQNGNSRDAAIKVIPANPESGLVLNEDSGEILKSRSAPLLTGSSVPELRPAPGGSSREKGAISSGQSGEQEGNKPEQGLQGETLQEIEKERNMAKFSLGPQVLAIGNQSETRSESKDAPGPSQDSQISHSRQSSQYETAEVTLEIADQHEEEETATEDGAWEPPVLPPTSRKRSLTVLTESGIIINQSPELPSSEKSADAGDPQLQSPESMQNSESSQSIGSQSGRSSTSTSTHSLERGKSFERIKSNKSFVATGSEEEEVDDYDVLSDLGALQSTPEFQVLGRLLDLPHQEVKMVFSSLCVTVLLEPSGEQLLKRSIRTIACCAQGKKESSCVGFISREGGAKKYYCHIFKAENEKMAEKVMESFKSAFSCALSASLSATLCDTCPLQQLHQLCRSLEGEPEHIAQSRVQECLQSLSEPDYTAIMQQFKSQEHSEHEFTQVVVLVSLLRGHFLGKQERHTHHIASQSGQEGFRSRGHSDTAKPTKRSALERAKQALASSFDNLRTRAAERRSAKQLQKSSTVETSEPQTTANVGTQSLNVPSGTSVFSRTDRLSSSVRLTAAALKAERNQENRGRSSSFRLLRRKNEDASGSEINESRSHSDDEKQTYELTPKRDSRKMVVVSDDEIRQGSATSSRSASPLPSSPPHTPPIQPKSDLTFSQSFPPSDFKTPPLSPISKKRNMRPSKVTVPSTVSFQAQALTPPSASSVSNVPFRKGHRRSVSMIFESVTPKKRGYDRNQSLEDWELIGLPPVIDRLEGSPQTTARNRWRQAIEQQILLIRMERQNRSVFEADMKRLKLYYSDPSLSQEDTGKLWTTILSQTNPRRNDIHQALIQGVPPGRRAEVWQFLIKQYKARQEAGQGAESEFSSRESCQKLCEEETEYETAIAADMGRTFPSHPYFSSQLKKGQQALYNILHAYAVLDSETGYCQGLSFVAGMFLMHTKDEESAFQMLCDFMILYNYRSLYSSDLSTLQVRLYQFSRILQDICPSLAYHLGQHDITPFFYAGPWFLTLFASQYPIAFVARVLDLFFYEGPDIVFEVSIALLNLHQDALLECSSMEATSHYLKSNLPLKVLDNLPKIISDTLAIDLGSKIQKFETEYEVYAELLSTFQISWAADTESTNQILKKQNKLMIEQLAICHGSIRSLESVILGMRKELEEQRQRIEKLESEQASSRPLPEGNS